MGKKFDKIIHPVNEIKKARENASVKISKDAQKIVDKYQNKNDREEFGFKDYDLSSIIKFIIGFIIVICVFIGIVFLTKITKLKTTFTIIITILIIVCIAVSFAKKIMKGNKR